MPTAPPFRAFVRVLVLATAVVSMVSCGGSASAPTPSSAIAAAVASALASERAAAGNQTAARSPTPPLTASPTPRPTYLLGDRVVLLAWGLTVLGSENQQGGRTESIVAQELAAKGAMSFAQALTVVRNASYERGAQSLLLRYGIALPDANAIAPSAGMRFVAVTMRLENTSGRVQTTNPGDFRLQDSNGVRRAPRSETLRPDQLGRAEVAPGGVVNGSIVFEAPIDDTALTLVLGSGSASETAVSLASR